MSKYAVWKHYRDYMAAEYETDDFRKAIDYCMDAELSRDNGHAVSIRRGSDSIFEINYYGNVELDIDECITREELLLLDEYGLIRDLERELEQRGLVGAAICEKANCQVGGTGGISGIRADISVAYKGLTIYEKGGLFTVGGPHNAEFNDCSLENLEYGPEEVELVAYCRENGIPLRFDDLRGHVYDVPYEKYLEHLEKYEVDPEGGFTDNEFIVPSVRCTSVDQVKALIDWIDAREQELFVDGVISKAAARAGESTLICGKAVEFDR